MCLDPVNDQLGKRKGDEAIFCDGMCKEWVHRQCAGRSRAHFENLSKSKDQFLCPKCIINNQSIAIKSLQQSVSKLRTDVDRLQLSSNQSYAAAVSAPAAPVPLKKQSLIKSMPKQQDTLSSDRKKNLVFYCLPESSDGTRRQDRSIKDFNAVNSVSQSLPNPISSAAIVECHRLGKYDKSRTRPTLAKFNSVVSVSIILKNKLPTLSNSINYANHGENSGNVVIKPDLSPEQRMTEHLHLLLNIYY